MLDDQEFFDMLHQSWSKTTGAVQGDWEVEQVGNSWTILARDDSGAVVLADLILSQDDAQFIAVVHGVLPEIIEKYRETVAASDRFEEERDEQIQRVYRLELENQNMRGELEVLYEANAKLEQKLAEK
jgi:hypothetical protein